MDRINRLLAKELDKPHTYQQLRKEPFPYLQECSRMQIFEFIHDIEIENRTLKQQIAQKNPGKQLKEIVQQNKAVQLVNSMLGIHRQSIEHMEIELKDKIIQVQELQKKNQYLATRNQELQNEMQRVQTQLIEVERERRQLQFQLRIYKERQEKGNTSQIFQALYKDVRNILEETL